MPRAILTFRLPDEQAEHDDATNGTHWRQIVEEIYELARAKAKHGEDDVEAMKWAAVQDEITQAVESRGLQMWVW